TVIDEEQFVRRACLFEDGRNGLRKKFSAVEAGNVRGDAHGEIALRIRGRFARVDERCRFRKPGSEPDTIRRTPLRAGAWLDTMRSRGPKDFRSLLPYARTKAGKR